MNNNYSSFDGNNNQVISEEGINSYVAKVYGWMFIGLILTAITSFFVLNNYNILYLVATNRLVYFGLFIGELLLVGFLSAKIHRMQYSVAKFMFVLYSIVNGVTLSVIFLAYLQEDITTAFLVTALVFGIMSVYGYITKNDLTNIGHVLIMALIGVIVISVINMFLNISSLQWIMSVATLVIFLGLTSYDTQKIKQYYYYTQGDQSLRKKVAILGALSLYLDFINIFISILRIFGRRR